jgi:hypothetical protein
MGYTRGNMHKNLDGIKLVIEIAVVLVLALLVSFGPALTNCDGECMAASIEALDRKSE